MKYYVGIDGGGTKTKAVLVDEDLNVIKKEIGGPSNFLAFDINNVSNSILELLIKLTEGAKISLGNVQSVLIGTAGAGRKDDVQRLKNSLIEKAKKNGITINNFTVDSDARIALEGAFAGKPGSILIAGTGSIMFGKDSDGNIHRVGGFGRILGDEGSGFHIGKAGLSAVAKSLDGRSSKTLLTELLRVNFGISNSSQLINEVYKNNFDIPKVAPLVIEAAQKDDKICKDIITSEIAELIVHIAAMKKLLNEKILSISLIGGTITTDNYYANLFQSKMRTIPNVKLVDAKFPPEVGAALMAIQV